MFCVKCGNKLDDNASFCGECGSQITPPTTNVNQYNAPMPNANQYNAPPMPNANQQGRPPKKPSGKAPLVICICVLVAIIAVLSAILIVQFGKGKDDAEATEKADKSEESTEETKEAEDQAELDEVIGKYKDFLNDHLDVSRNVSGYALVCLDDDDLPECFMFREEDTTSGRYGVMRYFLYYDKAKDECVYYDFSDEGGTRGMAGIDYSKKDGLLKMTACGNGGPNNSAHVYQFNSEGGLRALGFSNFEVRSDGTSWYSAGSGETHDTAIWRSDLTKTEYDEFMDGFGETDSKLEFKDSSLTLDAAYKKFQKKR